MTEGTQKWFNFGKQLKIDFPPGNEKRCQLQGGRLVINRLRGLLTISTKKHSRSRERKNQDQQLNRDREKTLHAQPAGAPKMCTTPCLTPTSSDGQTLLEVMPMTIVRERIPAHVSLNTISSRQTQQIMSPPHIHTKTENFSFANHIQPTPNNQAFVSVVVFQKNMGELLCVPAGNQSRYLWTSNEIPLNSYERPMKFEWKSVHFRWHSMTQSTEVLWASNKIHWNTDEMLLKFFSNSITFCRMKWHSMKFCEILTKIYRVSHAILWNTKEIPLNICRFFKNCDQFR